MIEYIYIYIVYLVQHPLDFHRISCLKVKADIVWKPVDSYLASSRGCGICWISTYGRRRGVYYCGDLPHPAHSDRAQARWEHQWTVTDTFEPLLRTCLHQAQKIKTFMRRKRSIRSKCKFTFRFRQKTYRILPLYKRECRLSKHNTF